MNDTIKFAIGALVSVAYIAGLIVLVWHRSITGDQALGAAGAVALPVIGAAIHGSGVSGGAVAASGNAPASAPTSSQKLPE